MARRLLSTVEVALKIGVPRATLQYWIKKGKIRAPKPKLRGGVAVRLWDPDDVREARELKGTLRSGPVSKRKNRNQ